ncbi:MAG TPA: hypothetical protein VKB14_02270 [Actinomycetales bacterium]|nr:hypothetical protein [Actinomycetales bacterium]
MVLFSRHVQMIGHGVRWPPVLSPLPTHHPEHATRNAVELTGLFRRGLGAIVTDRYPLERAVEALTDVAARGTTGKVVIDVGQQV